MTTKIAHLETRLAHAAEAHLKSTDAARDAHEAHHSACGIYAANPSNEAADAVLKARDAADLATVRRVHAEGLRHAAQADLDAAHAAQREVEAEEARRLEYGRLARLRERASIAGHSARIAAPVAVVVAAELALLEAFEEILASYAESNAAAAELRAAGEAIDDLDVLHVLGPILVARSGAVPLDLNPLRYAGSAATAPTMPAKRAPLALFTSLVQLVVPGDGQAPTSDEHADALRSELALRLETRTYHEAEATVRALHDARAAQAAAGRAGRAVTVTAERVEDEDAPGASMVERARSFFSADKAQDAVAS